MKKMRGMVALCVALTRGWLVRRRCSRRKPTDDKKEVKRSKAEQVDIDMLTQGRSTTVAAGRPRRPTLGDVGTKSLLPLAGRHDLRSVHGQPWIKSKLTSPNCGALRARVATKGAAGRAGKEARKTRMRAIHPGKSSISQRSARRESVALHPGEGPGDYDVYIAVKDKGTVEKADKNYTPRVGRAEEGAQRSRFQQAGARRRAA